MTSVHRWRVIEVIPIRDQIETFMAHSMAKTLTVLTWIILVIAVIRMSWPSEALSIQNSNPEVMAERIHQLELQIAELQKRVASKK